MTGLRRRILDRLLRRRDRWFWICPSCDRRSPMFPSVEQVNADLIRHERLCHLPAPSGLDRRP